MNKALRASVIAIALLGATATAGCAQLANLFNAQEVSTYDEKAAISVEKLYGYALDQAANASSSLTADQATAVSAGLAKAKAAVDKARKLYDDNAEAEASPETARALAAVQEVIALLVSAGVLK